MNDELVKRLRTAKVTVFKAEDVTLLNEAADAIEDLEFACNRYEKDYKDLCEYLPKWIPVTERLPEKGQVVLVWGGASIYTAKRHNKYGAPMWWKLNSKTHYCNPTHWMPLPEPPKEEA